MYLLKKAAHDDHDAGQMHESNIVMNPILHSTNEPLEVLQPTVGALDAVSALVSSELSTILSRRLPTRATVWANEIDSTLPQPYSERIAIRSPVIDEMLRGAWNFQVVEQMLDQGDFGGTGTVHLCRQRKSTAVSEDHDLASLAAFRVADARAPFFAREKVPSAKASSQSISPKSSKTPSKTDQISANSPDRLHSCSLRQQVAGDGKCLGKSFQRAPLRSSHRMPSKHPRGGQDGRPPKGLGTCSGKNSAIRFHCSSESCGLGSVLDALVSQTGQVRSDSVALMCAPPFRGTRYATPLPQRSPQTTF